MDDTQKQVKEITERLGKLEKQVGGAAYVGTHSLGALTSEVPALHKRIEQLEKRVEQLEKRAKQVR